MFAADQPATVDQRLTDGSQDELIQQIKTLIIWPSDLPPRPDFGTVGTNIKLRTNFFPAEISKKTFHEYHISITPATTIRRVKRRIFQLAEQTQEWDQHELRSQVAHDCSSKLVSINRLPQPLVINVVFSDEGEARSRGPREYTLTFTFVKVLDTSNLVE